MNAKISSKTTKLNHFPVYRFFLLFSFSLFLFFLVITSINPVETNVSWKENSSLAQLFAPTPPSTGSNLYF